MQTTHTRTLLSRLTLICGLWSIIIAALLISPARQISGQGRPSAEEALKGSSPSQSSGAEAQEPAATPRRALPSTERLGKYLELKKLHKELNSELAVGQEAREIKEAINLRQPVVAAVGGETCATAPLFTTSFSDSDTTTGHSDDLDPATGNTCSSQGPAFLFPQSGLGPDVVYRFNSPVSGVATALLKPTTNADLALYVLTPAAACAKPTTTGCVTGDDTGDAGAREQVTFSVTAGTDYFIVVDGFNGSSGPFTLNVTFNGGPAIVCLGPVVGSTSGNSTPIFYFPPIGSPTAGTITCTPASGSSFPVGTTTVNCTSTGGGSCSFPVTVNRVSSSLSAVTCSGTGNVVTGTVTITNNGAAPVSTVPLVLFPSSLLGLQATCTTNIGDCFAFNNAVEVVAPSLAVGQTLTLTYQAQVADSVTNGTQLCSFLDIFYGPNQEVKTDALYGQEVQACVTANLVCPAVGPGLTFPVATDVSDQKAGSVLVYNLYSSSSAAPATQNTRIAITNTNPALPIAVHLFFVDGATCSIADSVVCLTPNQTASFLASDIDPGTTGYIIAVASDLVTGCPVGFNYLIGDEYVKLSSGHAANLAAEAFAAVIGNTPFCNALAVTAVLNFNGTSYNRAPRVLAASNIPSRADGNDTLIVLNRLGGSLAAGAATLGSIFGILYDDAENPLSFTFPAGVCQFRSSLSNSFPRTAPRFEQFIPAGRSGWAKFFSLSDDVALLGAQINYNPSAGTAANAFNQGHNLHKLRLTTATTLTIPIFPPNC